MNSDQPVSPTIKTTQLWAEMGLVSLILMETFVTTAWYSALVNLQSTWLSAGVFLFISSIMTYLFIRIIRNIEIKTKIKSILSVFWFVILLFLGTRYIFYGHLSEINVYEMFRGIFSTITDNTPGIEGFWHMLVLTILFWRSTQLSIEVPGPYAAMQSFKVNIFLLLPFTILFSPDHPVESLWIGLGFFSSGLLMLSLTRLAYLSELRGGKLPKITIDRFLGIAAGAILCTLIAFLIAWAVSGTVAAFVLQMVGGFFILLSSILIILFIPLIALITSVVMRILPKAQAIDMTQIPTFGDMLNEVSEENTNISTIVIFLQKYGSLILLIASILIILLIILLSLRWQARRRKSISEVESDNTSSRFVLNLLPNFMKPLTQSGQTRVSVRRLVAAARIQQIYSRLMKLSAKLGKPRLPALTPLEFIPQLKVLFPEDEEALILITNAFIKVRYGELPESDEEVKQIIKSWNMVEQSGKELLKQKAITGDGL